MTKYTVPSQVVICNIHHGGAPKGNRDPECSPHFVREPGRKLSNISTTIVDMKTSAGASEIRLALGQDLTTIFFQSVYTYKSLFSPFQPIPQIMGFFA